MGRIALAALVFAGLSVPVGIAATAPKWTATGTITKLSARVITVHGTSCRISSASPARTTLRLYFVGARRRSPAATARCTRSTSSSSCRRSPHSP